MDFFKKNRQKGSFRSRTEKVNITIEFSTFELVQVPSFNLRKQFIFFHFFGLDLLRQGVLGLKKKKKHDHQ